MTGGLATGWERFWFRPQPTSTLAVVRIAYGLVVALWTLSLARDLHAFHSRTGIAGSGPGGSGVAVNALYVLLGAAAICLTLGLRTRLAAAVVFLVMLWFQRNNPAVVNAGDRLLVNLGFLLMLAPAGASLSLDRRRRGPRPFWTCPDRAPWALRLIQIQLGVMYLSTVLHKLQGEQWVDGTAVSYALQIGQLARFEVPGWVTDSIPLVNLLTWSTIAVEVALALLVWSRRLRPWVLGCGVLLHLGIDLTMTVGFLGPATMVAYLAFLSPEAVAGFLSRLGARRSLPADERATSAEWVTTT